METNEGHRTGDFPTEIWTARLPSMSLQRCNYDHCFSYFHIMYKTGLHVALDRQLFEFQHLRVHAYLAVCPSSHREGQQNSNQWYFSPVGLRCNIWPCGEALTVHAWLTNHTRTHLFAGTHHLCLAATRSRQLGRTARMVSTEWYWKVDLMKL
jgi:hypothetical protein